MENERKNWWNEVRCDYLDGEGFWVVYAWETDDYCEEGKRIAAIDGENGMVFYVDDMARTDGMAQEVIAAKVAEIKSGNEESRCDELADSVQM